MDLVDRVQKAIFQQDLLKPGEGVLVGVSGGVDSMVLLDLLRRIGAWKLHIAHFNHLLRGSESDADESFVQATAEKLHLPFVAGRGDVKVFADQNGLSIEMAARDLRHQFLVESANGMNLERIALAHHADDQIETFWLRLLRGDVGPGLAGIRASRPVSARSRVRFIRPLLEIPKSDLVAFARENEIGYRDDSSNSSPEYLRNRLRLDLVARLKTYQPALRDVTLRTAAVLAAEKDFLEKSARDWLTRRRPTFSNLHPALQREVIRVQIVAAGLKPKYELIEALRVTDTVPVSVSPEFAAARSSAGDVTVTPRSNPDFQEGSATIDLQEKGSASLEDLEVKWKMLPERGPAGANVEYFDANQVGPNVILRHWRRGDRIQPIGRNSPVKLQDLFTNLKIPALEKRRRFVAVDSTGKIFWVEGLRISELHKVSEQTTRVLKWSWRRRP